MKLEGSEVEDARGSGRDGRRKESLRDGKARGNITGGGQPLARALGRRGFQRPRISSRFMDSASWLDGAF